MDRDRRILRVLEELALEGHKVVRWTQLKEKTGFSDGTLGRRLKKLVKYGEILHEGIFYALPKFRSELEKTIQKVGVSRLPPRHRTNIASGFLALLYGVDYPSIGELRPNIEYAENALQHLCTGYRHLNNLCEKAVKYKKDKEKAIARLQLFVEKRLEEKLELSESAETPKGLAYLIIEKKGRFDKSLIRTECIEHNQHKKLFRVYIGPYPVNEFKEYTKAKQFTKDLIKSLEETLNLPEFKENLARIMKLSEEFSKAWEKLKDGIKLLTKKIESGTEGLKGRCEVCGRLNMQEKRRVQEIMRELPFATPVIL